jgi:hypothetical protein
LKKNVVAAFAVTYLITLALLVPLCHASSSGDNIKVRKEEIRISGNEVNEKIFFISKLGTYNGTVEIWVSSSNYELEYKGEKLEGILEGNVVELSLGDYGIVIPAGGNISINVSYILENKFEHKIIYSTDLVDIRIESSKYPRGNIPLEYKGDDVYTSSLISREKDDYIWIEFMEKISGGEINTTTLVIGLVAILAIIFIAFITKKRATVKLGKESVEALELRKKLLTDALKTLEIEHNKKKIPDSYYRSIKDYFKGETIKVLRELDKRA